MTTNFPSGLDSFTNPTATDAMDSVTVPHADQHADVNDAVEALQAKVGVDGSADTNSLDYKVANQGLVHIGTYTATDDSYLDIDGVFTSTFDAYRMVIMPYRADGDLFIQFRTGGSNSTSGYENVVHGISSAGGTLNHYFSGSEAYITLTNINTASVLRQAVTFDVLFPYQNNYTVITGTGTSYNTGGNYWHYNVGVTHTVSGQRDGIRIDSNSGLLSCKALVYGYNEG